MKRVFLTLVTLLTLQVSVFAAGSCTDFGMIDNGDILFLYTTCTADAAAATYPNKTFDSATGNMLRSKKMWLHSVLTLYGTTGPTDNTDLALNVTIAGKTFDILGGAGTDAIDNAANNSFYPVNTTGAGMFWPYSFNATQVISNNAVNSAEVTIVYIFSK